MKKYINGSRYDTSTARLIGRDGYSTPNDFSYWRERLYRTKSGKYFIHGEGGPNSKYRRQLRYNEWSGGEAILPLSENEARAWAEEHMDADQVDTTFGVVSEDTARLQVFIPADLMEQLDEKCSELHCSRAEVISAALRQYLNK